MPEGWIEVATRPFVRDDGSTPADACRETLELAPRMPHARECLVYAYDGADRGAEALREAARLLEALGADEADHPRFHDRVPDTEAGAPRGALS